MSETARIQEEGSLVAVAGHPKSANLTCLGLHALQHRGKETVGIISHDGSGLWAARGFGTVMSVFPSGTVDGLRGKFSIGQIKFCRTMPLAANVQPHMGKSKWGEMGIAFTGNIANHKELRSKLEGMGSLFFFRK